MSRGLRTTGEGSGDWAGGSKRGEENHCSLEVGVSGQSTEGVV